MFGEWTKCFDTIHANLLKCLSALILQLRFYFLMVEILEEEKCETNTIPATTQREWLEWVEKRTHLNHSKPFNRKCLPFLCGLKIRTRNLWIHMCWAFPAHAKLEEPSHSSLICFLNHLQYTFINCLQECLFLHTFGNIRYYLPFWFLLMGWLEKMSPHFSQIDWTPNRCPCHIHVLPILSFIFFCKWPQYFT